MSSITTNCLSRSEVFIIEFCISWLMFVIQIMCHDHPNDIRDGQLVYIERVAGLAMLERDGKVEN